MIKAFDKITSDSPCNKLKTNKPSNKSNSTLNVIFSWRNIWLFELQVEQMVLVAFDGNVHFCNGL